MNNKVKSIIKEAIYEAFGAGYGLNREADPYFFDPQGERAQYYGEIKEDVEFTLRCCYVNKNDEDDEIEKEFIVSFPMQLEYEHVNPDLYYPIGFMDSIDVIKYIVNNHMIPNSIGDYVLDEPLDAIEIIHICPNVVLEYM